MYYEKPFLGNMTPYLIWYISKKYEINHIITKILNPTKEELGNIFQGFNYEKIKTGKKITKLIFTWQRVEKKKKVVQKKKFQEE